jgi:hypothetical protein
MRHEGRLGAACTAKRAPRMGAAVQGVEASAAWEVARIVPGEEEVEATG